MSSVSGSKFAFLVARLREGCDDAAWELVELYGRHVLRVVRRHLSQEIRPKYDSDDFVQAVWLSFFSDNDKLRQVESPKQLVGLLAAMAKNKIIDESRRRLETEKFSVRKERSIDRARANSDGVTPSPDPTPSQFAIARERWNEIMAELPDAHREVLKLRMAGETHKTISARLGISRKTVQRILHRAFDALKTV